MDRKQFKHIIISRTDSIGDVMLTLPMAGVLKEVMQDCKITFLGRAYTRDIIALSEHVDAFIDWDEIRKKDHAEQVKLIRETKADLIIHVFPVKAIARLSKRARIPVRMGTTNRLYHWTTCNHLVCLSRRKSDLHEAQLNLKLIGSITGKKQFTLDSIPQYYGFREPEFPGGKLDGIFDTDRFNLIIHPKSKGSAREWGLDNFKALIRLLPQSRFRVFVTGTGDEGKLIEASSLFTENPHVVNLCGQLSLKELLGVIYKADGLLAASTGPLHLAAAFGIQAIGIYPPIRPMHPGRWAPLGAKATYLVQDKSCNDCRKSQDCNCIRDISPESVLEHLTKIV